MGNAVVHWELMSKEPEKVSSFYANIFGWKIQHRPEFDYRIVDTGSESGINGGIVRPDRDVAMGKFSLFTDPEGRMMGLWKAKATK